MENTRTMEVEEAEFLEAFERLREEDQKRFLAVLEAMTASDEIWQLSISFMDIVGRHEPRDSQYSQDALFVLARALDGDKTCMGIVKATLAEAEEAEADPA